MFTELSVTYGHCLKTLSTLHVLIFTTVEDDSVIPLRVREKQKIAIVPRVMQQVGGSLSEPRLIATDAAVHVFIGGPCLIYSCFSPTGNQAQAGQEMSFTAHQQ